MNEEFDTDLYNAQRDLEKSREQIEEAARVFLADEYATPEFLDIWSKRLTEFAMQEIAEFCGMSQEIAE